MNNIIEGTTKRDRLAGTEMSDRFFMSEGKDKIRNFDLEQKSVVQDKSVDLGGQGRGNNVIVFGDGFKTILSGVDCTDSLMIGTHNLSIDLDDIINVETHDWGY